MGDGIWNDDEPFTDSNGNNEYDIGEYFLDYGLDGCPDEYETGAPTFGCNSEPNYLTLFDNSDPNQDNNYGNVDGQENNFEYDLVVNARFDICWNRKYDLFNLNPNNFHIPIHWDRPHWGWPLQNPEISDHIFATNSNWMKHYATLYDKIDEYTLPGQCPQWNTISNHFLMVWHLRKLGLLSEDIVKKTFKVLHHSSKYIVGGSKDPNIDYDIFRFRELTREDLK